MDNTKLIAIVLVVVVVVGGIGAVVFLNNGSDDGGSDTDDSVWKDHKVPIFGNANNDTVIDSKDVETIQKICDGEFAAKDYPLADADHNGTVDAADIAVVNKIINDESTKVYFYDQENVVLSVNYPLKNVCPINADMTSLIIFFGGASKVAGYVCGNYPSVLAPVKDAVLLNSGRQLKDDGYTNAIQLSSDLESQGGIGAWIVDRNTALDTHYDDIVASGVPIINIRCTDPVLSNQGALLLGTLMGGEVQKNCYNYYKDCTIRVSQLNEMLDSIADEDRMRFISMTMVRYIAGDESQYDSFGRTAGGISATDLSGDGSTKLEAPEKIVTYDDKTDFFLNCATMDLVKVPAAKYFEHKSVKYLNLSSHFDDDTMVFINMSLPLPCRVAYAAAIMYPDVVSLEFADTFLKETIDKYLPYLNEAQPDGDCDIHEDLTTFLVYSDYTAEKAAA